MSKVQSTSSVLYRERLYIPATWWLVAAFISSMTALMVLPVWALGAVIVPVAVFIAVALVMRALIPTIVVTDGELFAGDAHIERTFITRVEDLDAAEAFKARGQDLDARAFLMTRPWVKPVVRVHIDDAADPTPYWLVSTRNAERLAQALRS